MLQLFLKMFSDPNHLKEMKDGEEIFKMPVPGDLYVVVVFIKQGRF